MFTQFRRKWSDRFVSGRLRARRRGQERTRVQLEILEDRTVFSTALGITFNAGAGPLPELAIQSYSWGAQGGTIPRVQDFTMTLAPGSVEPGLWGHLAANTHVNSAVIHVRNGGGPEYATYTLTDVLVSSFTTGETSGGAPQNTISLHFGKVAESYSPINSDGSLGTADQARYDVSRNLSDGNGSLAPGASTATAPLLGLSLVAGGVTLAEKDLVNYSWAAASSGGIPNLQDVTLGLGSTAAEPGFWGHLTANTHLDSAVIHVRNTGGLEYATYTLTDVTISSFTTSDVSGNAPQDTINLHFGRVAESYSPINSDGSLGTANIARFDQGMDRSDGNGSLAPGASTATAPVLGLTLVEGGVTLAEKDVAGYSWAAASSGGVPILEDVTLDLGSTATEPGFWGHLAANTHLDSAVIHVRTPGGAEYATYTLTDITISSFTTNDASGHAPQDTINLHFGRVAESYSAINSDGSLGTADTARFNQGMDRSDGNGSLAPGASTAAAPLLGLTLVEGGVTLAEKDLLSYSWAAASSGGIPRLQDVALDLGTTAAEPGFWGHLAANTSLDSAVIHVRNSGGLEYATYTLTDVTISSFTTSDVSGNAPQDTISLHFGRVAESYSPINSDGSLGTADTTRFDQAMDRSDGNGSLAPGASNATEPVLGLTLVEGGVTLAEKDLVSYSWAAASSGGIPNVQDVALNLGSTAAEPGFWGHLAANTHLDSAVIHVRNTGGLEYATYTLTDVTISSFTTSDTSGDSPQDTINLHFTNVAESYSPINSDGSLGTADKARFDLGLNRSDGNGSLTPGASTAAKPVLGLTLVEGGVTLAEKDLLSYSWAAASSGGIPSLQDFTLDLGSTAAEPGFWGHLTANTHLDSAVIHVRTAGGLEYATYTLTDVTISSFTTNDASGDAPQDTINLHFGKVTEGYSPINSDGSLGTANKAEYDQANNTSEGAGNLGSFVTTTSVATSVSSAVYGQSVMFTATVADEGATPTGSVEFFDGMTDLGPGTALSGSGNSVTSTFTISSLAAGNHAINAVYSPTGPFQGSSGMLTQTVNDVTSTSVASDHDPSTYGQLVTLAATVTNTSNNGDTPAGNVEFFDGMTDLGPGTALSGSGNSATSTFTVSSLAAGNHAINAVFTPAGFFLGSNGTLTQTVNDVTSTSVASNHNPSTYGQTAVLTATVTNTSNNGDTPAGSVEFFDGMTDLGPGTALSGSGNSVTSTFTVSTLSAADHGIKAVYTPAGFFLASNNTLTQTVKKGTTSTAVVSSANPSVFGQAVMFVATVSNSAGTGVVPTGSVQFVVDGANLGGPVALDVGGHAASMSFTFWTGTSHSVKAVYSNSDGNFVSGAGSLSQTVQTVGRAPDPSNPALTDLFVGGSTASNNIEVKVDKGQITVDLHDGHNPSTTALAGLNALVVYGQGKGMHIQVDKQLMLPAFLFAGNGANVHIEGGGGPTVEVGGSGGNAHLEGGSGRNILIAGSGGGHLEGKGGDDILIGGYTDFDRNLPALMSILAEWNSADSFPVRTASLSAFLNTNTVHDDGISDHLEGGGGRNWFFAKLNSPHKDKIDGVKANDLEVGIH